MVGDYRMACRSSQSMDNLRDVQDDAQELENEEHHHHHHHEGQTQSVYVVHGQRSMEQHTHAASLGTKRVQKKKKNQFTIFLI